MTIITSMTIITNDMCDAADRQIYRVDENGVFEAYYCAASLECGTPDDGGVFSADELRYHPSPFSGSFYCQVCHEDVENWNSYPTLEKVLEHSKEIGWTMTHNSHKTTSHWETWDQAFQFLQHLIPERRRGAELKRSASKDPKKKWVVIENHDVEDART